VIIAQNRQITISLTFPNFPDFSTTNVKFHDFSRFYRWVDTLFRLRTRFSWDRKSSMCLEKEVSVKTVKLYEKLSDMRLMISVQLAHCSA